MAWDGNSPQVQIDGQLEMELGWEETRLSLDYFGLVFVQSVSRVRTFNSGN